MKDKLDKFIQLPLWAKNYGNFVFATIVLCNRGG